MPGEPLLIGIAQLAVVIAGFAGITSALSPPGGSWSPGHRIRQRAVVSTSFNVMFESLLPVVAFYALADARQALVLASATVALYALLIIVVRGRQFAGADAARTRGFIMLLVPGVLATGLFALNALVFASVAVYALAVGVQLSVAAISFYSLVALATR
jgi:hypothetical protein